jgi:hydrogenase expression/formation protein HypE
MEKIKLSHGSGGVEMNTLITEFTKKFFKNSKWSNSDNDSAVFTLNEKESIVFTTDSFVIDPVFFPGGNIGDIAVCGTVNDLAVMGAKPIGLSLGVIIEEGFAKEDFNKIMQTIANLSKKIQVPIVTGDTKVMQKGKLDKIIINTSGVGIVNNNEILTKNLEVGDKIILSGEIGNHAIALLSKRFEYETDIITDSQPIIAEINVIKTKIKIAKDPTRGGLAGTLNEIAKKNELGINLVEEKIPIKKEVKKVCDLLGLNPYNLACEGRFVCVAKTENSEKVLEELKKFNSNAEIIGEISSENKGKVILQTEFGKRVLNEPTGNIVPRIC